MKKIRIFALVFAMIWVSHFCSASAPASTPHLVALSQRPTCALDLELSALKITIEKPVVNQAERSYTKITKKDLATHKELILDIVLKNAMGYQYPAGPCALMIREFEDRIEDDRIFIGVEKERLLDLLQKKDALIADDKDEKPNFELRDNLTHAATKDITDFFENTPVRIQYQTNKLLCPPRRTKSPKSS